jgi:hypothetical protein
MLRQIIAADHLPDYVMLEEPGDIIHFAPRAMIVDGDDTPQLSAAGLEAARALAPGWDIYALENEWKSWWAGSGRTRLRSPDRAFLGWLRKRLG